MIQKTPRAHTQTHKSLSLSPSLPLSVYVFSLSLPPPFSLSVRE